MLKLVPILAALAAATPAFAADPAPVLKADRDFAAMSAAKGPKAAFAAYFAPTATMVNQGILDGGTRDHFVAELPADPAAFEIAWTPVGGAMSDDQTMGVTWGTFTRRSGGRPLGEGSYATTWRKSAEGRWQVVLDSVSDRPAASPHP